MNICFIRGKIISDIEFKFIINSKNTAISIFRIELENKCKILVKAYNELADYCYRFYKIGDVIYIQGYIENNEIILEFIK